MDYLKKFHNGAQRIVRRATLFCAAPCGDRLQHISLYDVISELRGYIEIILKSKRCSSLHNSSPNILSKTAFIDCIKLQTYEIFQLNKKAFILLFNAMAGRVTNLLFNFTKNTYKYQIDRSITMSSIKYGKTLIYETYGEPVDVLKVTDTPDDKPKADEIAVKWLLSPVNPADINTIQGKYPSRPALPAVPGNEGVGEVIEIGSSVKEFAVGDRVVPNDSNVGTWRTNAIYEANKLLKIPKSFGNIEASMLNVNPCTAYRMLKDFVTLKPGDTVIQNGGNSAVGQLVIQLCKAWKLNSVNVVRDRDDIVNLKSHLMKMGGNEVLTETELRTTDLFKSKKLPIPKLALNCVCGQNAVEVLRHLGVNGIMVTYGGMSREPLIVPASALIFKNITVKGFWMTAWTKENAKSKVRTKMFDELGELFASKKLHAPAYKLIPFSQYQDAVSNALNLDGKTGVKYILDMNN